MQIILLLPCLIAFSLFDENLMSTNNFDQKLEENIQNEVQDHYLLTVSQNDSFFASGEKDMPLLSNNYKKDEEEEHITDKLSYLGYMEILWSKKVKLYFVLID